MSARRPIASGETITVLERKNADTGATEARADSEVVKFICEIAHVVSQSSTLNPASPGRCKKLRSYFGFFKHEACLHLCEKYRRGMESTLFSCQACLPNRLAAGSLGASSLSHVKGKARIVCLQSHQFGLHNVSQALQQIGDRITKNDNVTRLGEFLKHNEKNEESQNVLEGETETSQGSNSQLSMTERNEEFLEKEGALVLPYVSDHTIDATTPKGELSPAAISCIEQFSRLNGKEGRQMMQEFYSQCTDLIQSEGRHLVEYCCFKYIAGCSSDIYTQLKDVSFRRLIFITMLAWQHPYTNAHDNWSDDEKQLVGERAFLRIAPTVQGIADRPTAHHFYEILTDGKEGLSYNIWQTYLLELLRINDERVQHKLDKGASLNLDAEETILCVAASKQQPVQLWNSQNIAWPGRLTLTDRALYFEPNGVFQHRKALKLDLSGGQGKVERKKVGPLGAPLFDSAITVSSNPESDSWIIEFVDLSGERRREVWFAFIKEVISAYTFITEFGPANDDPMLCHVQGSQNGNRKVLASMINGIGRVQAVQLTLGRSIESPGRLLQFSRTSDHSYGDLVKEVMAVSFWGGHFDTDQESSKNMSDENAIMTQSVGSALHVTDIDGSVYLQRWMKSPTWRSSRSLSFWKDKAGGKGLILGKDLVIGDLSRLERAVKAFRDQSQMLERTKATIDGALVKGIPSNIDLLKELMVPFTLTFIQLRKLQKWKNPQATFFFLASSLLVLYKGWLKHFLPVLLFVSTALVFALHNQKSQGRLDDGFGRVVIREQPPSNTLQKILALKEALEEVEIQIQNVNIALLKMRHLLLAGHPQARNAVAFALLSASLVLMLVPFRYVCAFLLLDQFTCELEFRRGMVKKLARQVQDWWEALPAARVVVLPYDDGKYQENGSNTDAQASNLSTPKKGDVIAEALREWVAESF